MLITFIQIGYYHLCSLDKTILCNTDFHDLESVFGGAWPRIVSAIGAAKRYGIGVLLGTYPTLRWWFYCIVN